MSIDMDYVDGLKADIETALLAGRKGLFRLEEKISDETARYIIDLYKHDPTVVTKLTKCGRCKMQWEVFIYFEKRNAV